MVCSQLNSTSAFLPPVPPITRATIPPSFHTDASLPQYIAQPKLLCPASSVVTEGLATHAFTANAGTFELFEGPLLISFVCLGFFCLLNPPFLV